MRIEHGVPRPDPAAAGSGLRWLFWPARPGPGCRLGLAPWRAVGCPAQTRLPPGLGFVGCFGRPRPAQAAAWAGLGGCCAVGVRLVRRALRSLALTPPPGSAVRAAFLCRCAVSRMCSAVRRVSALWVLFLRLFLFCSASFRNLKFFDSPEFGGGEAGFLFPEKAKSFFSRCLSACGALLRRQFSV